MNRARLVLAALAAAALVSAPPALALVTHQPVKLRLAGARPVITPGEPATLSFELASADDAEIGRLEVASPSLARPFATRAARSRVGPATPLRFEVDVLPGVVPEPLVVRYEVNGRPVERTLDLSPLLAARAGGAPLERVSEVSRRPLPHSEAELEAMRGARTGRTAPGADLQHYRDVRVRGRFVYYRSDGPTVGVDGIRVRIKNDNRYSPDDTVVDGYTDPDGWFDLTFHWSPHPFSPDQEPDVYVQFESESGVTRVQSAGLEIEYSWRTPTNWNYDGEDIDVGTWTPTDRWEHGALHIFTNIRRNHRWFRARLGDAVPETHVQWPDGESRAWYERAWQEIHIGSERTWDESLHGHEYMHHYMFNFAALPIVDYCNGTCDGGECGHCVWCEEDEAIAYSEGVADWMGHVLADSYEADYGLAAWRNGDNERLRHCDGVSRLDFSWRTEGFFAAFLQDLSDGDQDDEPLSTAGMDATALDVDEIFTVLKQDTPGTTFEFFDAFRARNAAIASQVWQTANNNLFVVDAELPSAVPNLHSTSHTINLASPQAKIAMDWDPATDDWSGIAGYDFAIDRPDPLPDTTFALGDATVALTYHLPPGTYFIKVRARDRANKPGPWATAGPYVLVAPTPADLVFVQPGGWPRPIVPNSTTSATSTNVPYPSFLNGNTNNTYVSYAYANTGQQSGIGSCPSWLLLDGAHLGSQFNVSPAPGQTGTVVNRGPFTVRGGRHYVGGYLDELWFWPEKAEDNNTWGGPWVWSRQVVSWGTRTRRAAPPGPTDGWWYVRDPIPLHYSCDGLGIQATNWWHVLWIAADADSADYDLRIYNGASGVDAGFDFAQGASVRGPGCLDLVVVNRHNTALANWDVGVTNASGAGATYVAGSFYNEGLPVGTTYNATFWDSTYVRLFEIVLTGGAHYTLRATGDPDDGPFRAALVDRAFARGGLSDGSIASVDSDEDGVIRFDFQAPATGAYGFLVYRDPKDGRGSRQILLEVKAALPDLAPVAGVPWPSPLVPHPDPVSPGFAPALPDTLHGDVPGTFLNYFVRNLGFGSAGAASLAVELDGLAIRTASSPALGSFIGYPTTEADPVTVRGGRHTLALRVDTTNLLDELYEDNNAWGEQWVWSPLELAPGTPVTRSAPPDRTGGWAHESTDSTAYYNCDGLRMPALAHAPAEWAGVAVMPGDTSQVDLQLHEPSHGARDGFAAALAVATWGPGESNYLLADFGATARRALDVGAVNANGGAHGYGVEVVASTLEALPASGVIGPLTLPAGRALSLTEVPLTAGRYLVRLVPGAGASLDWGLSAHAPGAAFQSKNDAAGLEWLNGPGQAEEFLFDADADDVYCFAAWKVGAGDLPGSAQYTLEITPSTVGAGGPAAATVTRLHPAAPSPFRERTSLAFDLARDGAVSLEVYDLRGARVRTLADGRWNAGRHRVAWDGRNGEGRPLGAGVYLVRLEAGGRRWSTKAVRLK